MAWRGYRALALDLTPDALVRGWREEARTLFVERTDPPTSGTRLALTLACPDLPHRALVRATVTMARHAGGKNLPPGFECWIDPRDAARVTRLAAAALGRRAPYFERRFERIPGDLPAHYHFGLFAGGGRVRDVSLGGAYVELSPGAYVPRPTTPVELRVELPRRLFRRSLRIQGKVAWVDADRGFGVELPGPVDVETRRLVEAIGGREPRPAAPVEQAVRERAVAG